MMKWNSLLLALICVAAPLAARAGNVSMKNTTGHCAWVTVYTAYKLTRWEIVEDQYGRPRPELKVRAEIMRNADCSGGTIADVSTPALPRSADASGS